MDLNDTHCLIIGASHAGGNLATALRKEGWVGRITLLGAETSLPYRHPPLSKDYLTGAKQEADLELFSASALHAAGIELLLGEEATAIDRQRHEVTLKTGRQLGYTKLALCTGARVRTLPIPGGDLAGVHYLRTLTDARQIRAQIREGGHAVIIGGGYIGLETAASLRKLGMQVTLLEVQPRLLERVTAPVLSAWFQRQHEQQGVRILPGVSALSITGETQVSGVICSHGEHLPADLVIIGIGVIPNTHLAEAAGLQVGNGVIVNELTQTSDPDIVAAGDCANHPDALYGFRLRLESVPNALEQARTAAATLCGKHKPYRSLPWFWSEQYDFKLQIAGINAGYDAVVVRGDPESKVFSVWYLRQNQVIACDCINQNADFALAKKLISQPASINAADLADPAFDLASCCG
jgi:3-phenylpropionate/trans-cinnamate dioxygenase ferredoxin reductase subunit